MFTLFVPKQEREVNAPSSDMSIQRTALCTDILNIAPFDFILVIIFYSFNVTTTPVYIKTGVKKLL